MKGAYVLVITLMMPIPIARLILQEEALLTYENYSLKMQGVAMLPD